METVFNNNNILYPAHIFSNALIVAFHPTLFQKFSLFTITGNIMSFVVQMMQFVSTIFAFKEFLKSILFKFRSHNRMTAKTHDFIFSNLRRYRISRHVVFWFLWFAFLLLAVHIPTNRFPNWNIEYNKSFVNKRGGMFNFIWTLVYRQSWILLSEIAFTYILIYNILPRYYGKKNKISTTIIVLFLFIAFIVLNYFIHVLISYQNVKMTRSAGLPIHPVSAIYKFKNALFTVTFNFATVLAIAVIIKLMKRWLIKQNETAQVIKEKSNAELQLLKAQVHPHFLFNSLNNIYSFALEGSPKAPEMIQKLVALLHYILLECKQSFVPVETELQMIKDYVALERIRYGDRLKIDIQISGPGSSLMIAPLLLIPLVENSFKHGASRMLAQPFVQLDVSINNSILDFRLTNSRPSEREDRPLIANGGLGLKNVKRRLELIYANEYELHIIDEPSLYSVCLKIALMKITLARPGKLSDKKIIVNEIK